MKRALIIGSRMLGAALCAALLAAPFALLAADPPVTMTYQHRLSSFQAFAGGCGVMASALALFLVVRSGLWAGFWKRAFFAGLFLLGAYGAAVLLLPQYSAGLPGAAAALAVSGTCLCFYAGGRRRLPYAGLCGAAAVFACLAALENMLRRLPSDVLAETVRNPPSLAAQNARDRHQSGFRVPRDPCTPRRDRAVQVLIMGGKPATGAPLKTRDYAYPALLRQMLEESPLEQRFEIIDGAQAGQSLVDILAVLEGSLALRPDLIIVSSGEENYGAREPEGPGWALSDRQKLQRQQSMARLTALPGYKIIRRSYTAGIARYYLLAARERLLHFAPGSGKEKRRVPPEDYSWALRRLKEVSTRRGFPVVLMAEPISRGSGAPLKEYKRELRRAADELSLPVVDPQARMPDGGWYFYDKFHLNRSGHRKAAEALYEEVFLRPPPELQRLWTGAGRPQFRPVERMPRLTIDRAALDVPEIAVTAAAPYAVQPRRLILLDGRGASRQEASLGTSPKEFSFLLSPQQTQPPLVELTFTAPLESAAAKGCGRPLEAAPVYVEAASGGGQAGACSRITVDGVDYGLGLAGYNAVVIENPSGVVAASRSFNTQETESQSSAFVRFLKAAATAAHPCPPLIVIAVKSDGGQNLNRAEVRQALRLVGGSGELPKPFESFVLIGSPGAPPGSALEKRSSGMVRIVLGEQDSFGRLLDLVPAGRLAAD